MWARTSLGRRSLAIAAPQEVGLQRFQPFAESPLRGDDVLRFGRRKVREQVELNLRLGARGPHRGAVAARQVERQQVARRTVRAMQIVANPFDGETADRLRRRT